MLSLQAFQGEEHQPFLWNGGAPAALLVHGFPGSPAELRPLADALYVQGWTVQGLLLPGFGPEFETLANRRSEEWFASVRDALRALKQEHETVVLIGLSMGGALALRVAAVEAPAALVLLAPFWTMDSVLWRALPLIKTVFPTFPIFRLLKLDFSDPEVREGIRTFMPQADLDDPAVQDAIRNYRLPLKMFNEIRRTGLAAYESVKRVSVPTLIIQGLDDELVKPVYTRRLKAMLPGETRYLELPADHVLLNSEASAWGQIRQSILDFAELSKTRGV